MLKKYIFPLGMTTFIVCFPATAQNWQSINNEVTFNTSLGWLGGESKEYVYDEGHKVSQLDWKIKNAAIIKGDISWTPVSYITLNARGWTTLASGSGEMEDYDWQDENQSHWTDKSTHPDTPLNYANEFDINIKGWIFNQPNYRFGGVVGYQQTRYSWTSYGGTYNYDNGTDKGEFPRGEIGIGYQQKFSAPYMGVAGMYRYKDVEFNALFKFSPWVEAKDNDEHYLRDTTFRSNTKNSRYYFASVDAGYYVTPNVKVFTELSWAKYEKEKGSMEVANYRTGEREYYGSNTSGIENESYMITAGIQYRF